VKGLYLPTPAQIGQFEKYAKSEFSIGSLYTYFFILEHAYFSVKYWELAKKVEDLIG
jgi:hypothetical protein